MSGKNKNLDKIQEFCIKIELIQLRAQIRSMKESKKVPDIEILRYVYKSIGQILKM